MARPYPALRTTASIGTVAVLFAGAALGAAPAATARPAAAAVAASAPSLKFYDIPGSGGITLKGNVFTPAGAEPGDRYPLIVLPTGWSMPQVEYLAQAQQLADSGYVVVSYTSLGFWLSGGRIEVAGPPDLADASSVIDWALANTPSGPDRIGMGGVSYGAGISLLAAGHDKRIKAVVALSGWADLIDSIYSGRTQHLQAAALLGGAGVLTGRPSDELNQTLTDFLGSNLAKEQDMIAWGKKRSPGHDCPLPKTRPEASPCNCTPGAWNARSHRKQPMVAEKQNRLLECCQRILSATRCPAAKSPGPGLGRRARRDRDPLSSSSR